MNKQVVAMMWGAAAGLLPPLLTLYALPAESLGASWQSAVFVGESLRVLIAMTFGALLVYFNKELSPIKAFQLGILAPAIFIGLQNGAALKEKEEALKLGQQQASQVQSGERPAVTNAPTRPTSRSSFSFMSAAHAQSSVPKGQHSDVGIGTRIWYGLTGDLVDGWFVVAGSHREQSNAAKQAEMLKARGWNVVVGEPAFWGGYHAVLIGSYLSKERAEAIRELALSDGLPKDTYVWRR